MAGMALLRKACYRELGRHFTFELALKKDHNLVTGGPYSIVRHPGYAACSIHFVAAFLAQLGPGSWFYEGGYWNHTGATIFVLLWKLSDAGAVVAFVIRTKDEDEMLRRAFPAEWEVWAQRTPHKLIPYVY